MIIAFANKSIRTQGFTSWSISAMISSLTDYRTTFTSCGKPISAHTQLKHWHQYSSKMPILSGAKPISATNTNRNKYYLGPVIDFVKKYTMNSVQLHFIEQYGSRRISKHYS